MEKEKEKKENYQSPEMKEVDLSIFYGDGGNSAEPVVDEQGEYSDL